MNAGVYFVQHGDDNAVKVGCTRDLFGRLSSMQTATPHKLHLQGFLRADDPLKLEAKLHHFLSPYHLTGEWFNGSQVAAAMRTAMPRAAQMLWFTKDVDLDAVGRRADAYLEATA